MLRTASLCAVLLWAAYACAGWLTHDYQVWTEEGARRLEVALKPVPLPPVTVEGPGVPARDLRALAGNGREVTIVDFFYTRCVTVCLSLGTTFQQMQAALQRDAKDAHVRLLSISFDGERDTPGDLARYAQRMQADPAWWRFVRVTDAAATQRLLADLRVVVVPNGRGDFEHNAALLVLDAQGRLVRVFDLSEQQLALDYARHLAEGGRL